MIAKAVAMAIGDEEALRAYCGDDYLAVLTEVARREGTQYSWLGVLVAEVDGTPAGAIVGYDGALLEVLREGTYAVIREYLGRTPTIPNETEAGEFYLDSVGVLPQFRGLGVGRSLLSEMTQRALAEGHERVGLIVDFANPRAEALYNLLGFERVNATTFLGHDMWHMQAKKP